MNPLAVKVTLPFRSGSINCTLNIAGIYRAEQDLNMPIISPSEIPFGTRPIMVQKVCYLYAALSGVAGLEPSIDECRAAMAGPKSCYIQMELDKLLEGLTPQLLEYNKQFQTGKSSSVDPLEDAPGGAGNGLMPSPLPESPAKSSGASRRGK